MKSMTHPWVFLVQDPGFIRENMWSLPNSRAITILTIDFADDNKIEKEFSFEIGRKYPSFALSNYLVFFDHKVCNPTTGEVMELPDMSVKSISLEAGYIPSNNTYKIVNLFCSNHAGEIKFETLTLTDGGPIPSSWVSTAHREWVTFVRSDAMCADGVVYWLVTDGNINEKYFISMELAKEEFLTIGCPKEDESDPYGFQLAELIGKLCLAYYSRVGLFLLKNCKKQTWVKEYNIRLSGMRDRMSIVGYVSLGGNNDGYTLFDGWPPILYNIKEKRFRTLTTENMRRLPTTQYINVPRLFYERCFTMGIAKLPLRTRVISWMRNLPSKISKWKILPSPN